MAYLFVVSVILRVKSYFQNIEGGESYSVVSNIVQWAFGGCKLKPTALINHSISGCSYSPSFFRNFSF